MVIFEHYFLEVSYLKTTKIHSYMTKVFILSAWEKLALFVVFETYEWGPFCVKPLTSVD